MCGMFYQTFKIETRLNPKSGQDVLIAAEESPVSYMCNLVLKGKSTLPLRSSNNSLASSLMSDSSTLSVSSLAAAAGPTAAAQKVTVKINPVSFSSCRVSETSRAEIFLQNKESFACKINIMPVLEPFFHKNTQTTIKSMHSVRIPITFKPTVCGEYKDKILIRVEGYDTPLSCLLLGKCVK
jgi:hypothetical protein